MVAHPALDAQTERADLARLWAVRVAPTPRVAGADPGGDPLGRTRFDHGRFERPHEGAYEDPAVVQLHDRVGHELPGAVVGHLTAALDADDLDAAARELGRRGEDVARVGLPPEGQDGRMLDEQEPVADLASRPRVRELPLERPDRPVVRASEPHDFERPCFGFVDRAKGRAWLGRCVMIHRGTIAGRPRAAVRRGSGGPSAIARSASRRPGRAAAPALSPAA